MSESGRNEMRCTAESEEEGEMGEFLDPTYDQQMHYEMFSPQTNIDDDLRFDLQDSIGDEDIESSKDERNNVKMGFYSDCKWIGPIIPIGPWRDENYLQLGDEYMDETLPLIDACMIAHALQINPLIADELISVCDPKQLRCMKEPEFSGEKLSKGEKLRTLECLLGDEDITLNTLRMRKVRISAGDSLCKDENFMSSKFFATNSDKEERKAGEKKVAGKKKKVDECDKLNRVKSPEVVLTIAIMRVDSPHPDCYRCRVSHEMEVLSGQTLSAFRDSFPCSLDKTHFGEFSSKPNNHTKAPTFRYKFPSSCFFIEGVFYDDLREPEAIRLSDSIVKWSTDRERGWKGFKQCSTSMHLVRFEDITVQLGKPYLFLHQGDCEHVWMVTSVRLYHPHDLPLYTDYPRTTGVSYFHRRKCVACAQYSACWMLVDDELMTRSPAFLCDRCLKELHYDHRGKKLGHFKALHFVDPSRSNIT